MSPYKLCILLTLTVTSLFSGLIDQGEELVAQNRLEEAKNLLQQVLEQDEESKRKALKLLGEVSVHLGQFPEAYGYFKKYKSLYPDEDIPLYVDVLMELGRYDLALKQLSQSSSPNPISVLFCLVYTNQFEKGEQGALHLLTQKHSLKEKLQIAEIFMLTGNQKEVKSIIEKAQSMGANPDELIRLWISLGEYSKALALVDRYQGELEKTPEGLLVLAELYLCLSKQKEALQMAERVIQLDPENVYAMKLIGGIEKDPKVLKETATFLKKAIDGGDKDVTLRLQYAQTLTALANASYAAGEIEEVSYSYDLHRARAVLDSLAAQNPDIPEISLSLGKVLFLLKEYSEAENKIKKVLEMDVSSAPAYLLMARIYEEQGKGILAIRMTRQAIKFDPSNADAWEYFGILSEKEGNFSDAIDSYRHAVKFKPNSPFGYVQLSRVLLEIKNPEDAKQVLEEAQQRFPHDHEITALLQGHRSGD